MGTVDSTQMMMRVADREPEVAVVRRGSWNCWQPRELHRAEAVPAVERQVEREADREQPEAEEEQVEGRDRQVLRPVATAMPLRAAGAGRRRPAATAGAAAGGSVARITSAHPLALGDLLGLADRVLPGLLGFLPLDSTLVSSSEVRRGHRGVGGLPRRRPGSSRAAGPKTSIVIWPPKNGSPAGQRRQLYAAGRGREQRRVGEARAWFSGLSIQVMISKASSGSRHSFGMARNDPPMLAGPPGTGRDPPLALGARRGVLDVQRCQAAPSSLASVPLLDRGVPGCRR